MCATVATRYSQLVSYYGAGTYAVGTEYICRQLERSRRPGLHHNAGTHDLVRQLEGGSKSAPNAPAMPTECNRMHCAECFSKSKKKIQFTLPPSSSFIYSHEANITIDVLRQSPPCIEGFRLSYVLRIPPSAPTCYQHVQLAFTHEYACPNTTITSTLSHRGRIIAPLPPFLSLPPSLHPSILFS